MDDKAHMACYRDSRQAGIEDELRRRWPDARLPAGLCYDDFREIEQIFADWELDSEPRPIVMAFKVYARVAALLHAKGLRYPQ